MKKRVAETYLWLRGWMALIAFVFPIILTVYGWLWAGLPAQDSLSADYHTGDGAMRDWFVGLLFALGIILIVYRGFSDKEDALLNIGGWAAWGIAIFPMAWPGYPGFALGRFSLHGLCAFGLFFSVGLVCWLCASDTLEKSREEPVVVQGFRKAYFILGLLMFVAPVTVFLLAQFHFGLTILMAEAAGMLVFAVFWALKTYEIWLFNKFLKIAGEALEPVLASERTEVAPAE